MTLFLPQESGEGGPNGVHGVSWNLDFSGGLSSAFFSVGGQRPPGNGTSCYGGVWRRGGGGGLGLPADKGMQVEAPAWRVPCGP